MYLFNVVAVFTLLLMTASSAPRKALIEGLRKPTKDVDKTPTVPRIINSPCTNTCPQGQRLNENCECRPVYEIICFPFC